VGDIEYDPMKDRDNQRKHALPLGTAALLFDGPYIEEEDRRRDYCETRFIATGPIELFGNRIFVVIYTWRENTRRIISFRKANEREIRKYRANLTR
jgi:uncharacterized DUF497 family protein